MTGTENPRFKLGLRDTLRVLWPYVKRNFLNQVQGIWFIVTYLVVFQLIVLQLPIAYALMIGVGIIVVALGLMFFMEGLRLGLMPLGEQIGSELPKNSSLPVILVFAFLLGVGATFAEPAIAVLKSAGAGVKASDAPLLYSLLNDFSSQLVASVGIGVGIAVALGVLRFFYAWPLKYLAIPVVLSLLGFSFYFSGIPELSDVLGLAWDCGAVTTGPVTVPLVLALGIGVCRVVSADGADSGNSGFGIVTLASLFPILAVMSLAFYHYQQQDYVGAPNYIGSQALSHEISDEQADAEPSRRFVDIQPSEFEQYLATGELPDGYTLAFDEGNPSLVEGRIVLTTPKVIIEKTQDREFSLFGDQQWDSRLEFTDGLKTAGMDALRAIVPLCIFLYFVLRMFLKRRLSEDSDVSTGITFALVGMTLFGLGIAIGLTPLGAQLGSNVPLAFAEIVPFGLEFSEGPLFDSHTGKLTAIGFAFFLGYGATLAEPALNALGDTVERITVGAFRKKLLMQSVALGVGLGIAAGILKMAYNLPLIGMLIPPYLLVVALTIIAPHSFVNFSWDSAGVTTGPITVPLVLAMGLGVGANIPGVSDGFGILALASVGPILTVLMVGLYSQRQPQNDVEEQSLISLSTHEAKES
ncbi:MAG: DUF1538 domain-containing protein [Pseudomonadota bacterium]